MALTVLPKLKNPASAFISFLVERDLLKAGFAAVLSGRDFPEIDQYLLDKKLISPEKLAQSYAEFYGLPFVRLINQPILPSVINLLPAEIARKYVVVPFKLEGLNLHLAIGEPSRLQKNAPSVLINLHHQKGLRVHLSIVPKADAEAVLDKVHLKSDRPVTLPINAGVRIAPAAPVGLQPEVMAKPAPEVKALNKQDLIKEVENREKVVDLKTVHIPTELMQKIPFDVAKRYQLIAFGQEKPKGEFEPPLIKIAMVSPDDPKTKEIINYIESRNKVLVDRYKTSLESFQTALKLLPTTEKQSSDGKIEEEKIEPPGLADTAAIKGPVTPPPLEKVVKPIPTRPEDLPNISAEARSNLREASNPKLPDLRVEESKLSDRLIAIPAAASVKDEPSQPVTRVQGVTEGLTLSSGDIINRPTLGETTEELQRLAKEQENSLDSQNLDSLLRTPVTSVEELSKVFKSGVIPEIVAATLFLAIRMKASDVHVEALADSVRLRFRIDGILHDIISVPHFLHAPLTSRIKILAKMKIDEQRIPQDGRFDVVIDNRQVDLRVSTLPTVHGEKIVMRLLDKSAAILTLEQLGVTGTNFDTLIANVNKPYGIIMSTGPTGSGKSTTLYAILTRISKPGVNIITLEDPVEYELPGVNQSQVKPQIGFTFAEGLRSVLRQDPNIIMVGEIRDLETAAMATHAALTGHLVLTTLHTNDAAGALPRLINMGVEPFLITSSLNAVIGQRLVRKICEKCRARVTIPHTLLETIKQELAALPSGQMKNINLDQLVFYHGQGCPECDNGYSGRLGIFEVLPMNSRVEELAIKKAPASEIKKAAIASGMITMIQDGLLKALKGITTVDEVMRVTTTHTKEVPGLEP